MLQKKKRGLNTIGKVSLAVGISLAVGGGTLAITLPIGKGDISKTTAQVTQRLLQNVTPSRVNNMGTAESVNEQAIKDLSVDAAKAQAAVDAYQAALDRAYPNQQYIPAPSAEASNKLTAPGTYIPFLDIGLMYWSTAKPITDTFKDSASNLYFGSFLTAPNRGFKSESGNESWASQALTATINAVNYNIATAGPKSGSGDNYEIPVAWGGAFAFDFAAQIDALGGGINVFDKIRNENNGDIMFSIGGWRSNSFATTVAMAQDRVGNDNKFNAYYLAAIYAYIIDKLKLNALDFDIEGSAVPGSNRSSGDIYGNGDTPNEQAPVPTDAQAARGLQLNLEAIKILRSMDRYKPVKISFTLPVLPTGFKDDYVYEMARTALNQNLIYRMYLMVLDFNVLSRRALPGEMAVAAISAVNGIANKLREDPFYNADTDRSLIYRRLGVIPMLGKNDVKNEVFTLTDARILTNWAMANNVASFASWSYNKDVEENRIGNAGEFESAWTTDLASSFDKAESQKQYGEKRITGKNTLLNTRYRAFARVFANLASRTPIPADAIFVSPELKQLLAAYGITGGLAQLYASTVPFYDEQKLTTNWSLDALDAIWRREFAFYDDYIKDGAVQPVGPQPLPQRVQGLAVALDDQRAQTTVEGRSSVFGITGEAAHSGLDADGNLVGDNYIPSGTVVWYNSRWYRAEVNVYAPKNNPAAAHTPDNAPGEWRLLAPTNDPITPLQADVIAAKAAEPTLAMDNDPNKGSKWGMAQPPGYGGFDGRLLLRANNRDGTLVPGQTVWYENLITPSDTSPYNKRWYKVASPEIVVGVIPNDYTVGNGWLVPVDVADPAKIDQAAAEIAAAQGETAAWTGDFVTNGLRDKTPVTSVPQLLAVLNPGSNPSLTALLNKLQTSGRDVAVALHPADELGEDQGRYFVRVYAKYAGIPVDLALPVTFASTGATTGQVSVAGVNLAPLANKTLYLSTAELLAGNPVDLTDRGAVIPNDVANAFDISVKYDRQGDGTYRATLVLTKKSDATYVRRLTAPETLVVRSLEDAVRPTAGLAAKLTDNPLYAQLAVSDFQVTGTNDYAVTGVKYVPPIAGATIGTALVTVRRNGTATNYEILKQVTFTTPSAATVNRSTSSSNRSDAGAVTNYDDRLKALQQSGYDTVATDRLAAQTGLTTAQIAEIASTTGDSADQANVDATRSELAKLTRTTRTRAAFTALAKGTTAFDSQAASDLGFTRPTLPTGVSVQVLKTGGDNAVTYTVSKGGASDTIVVSVTSFSDDQDGTDVETAGTALAAIDTTTKPSGEFGSITLAAGTALDSATATRLGITLPNLPAGVTVTVQKNSGPVLSFRVSKGAATKDASATITEFGIDQDGADVATARTNLASIDTTTKTSADFTNLLISAGTALNSATATRLGITVPSLPSGITVTVQKASGALLSFRVSKGAASGEATATVSHFGIDQDSADVDTARTRLAAVNATTKSNADFTGLTVPAGTTLDSATASRLGITVPTLPAGVTVTVAKASGANITFTAAKGAFTRTAMATVTAFGSDQSEADLDEARAALSAVDATTKNRTDFSDLTLPSGTNLDAATVRALGITVPRLPDGTSVTVHKTSGTALAFRITKGGATKSAFATITKFAPEQTGVAISPVVAVLSNLTTTNIGENDFAEVSLPTGTPFDEAAATRLGFTLPELPSGVTVTARKQQGALRLDYTVNAGGGLSYSLGVTVTSFATNATDEQRVAQAMRLLSEAVTTRRHQSDFKRLWIGEGTHLNKAAADQLGIDAPSLASGVAVTVQKDEDAATVTYTVTSGALQETMTATFRNFAAEPAAAGGSSADNLPAIIGGSVGGAAGLAALAGGIAYLVRRSKKRRSSG